MSDISQWSTSAASNNAAPPDGFPEGMAPSTVNDAAREILAAVARQYQDTAGGLVTAGTGNAYTLTTNTGHAALADQGLLVVRMDRANTGPATLNVDGLGLKAIEMGSAAIASGDLVADALYVLAYNATSDTYDILNGLAGVGVVGLLDSINNDNWTGTDLSIANGGTGASSAGAALTALGAAPTTLSGVDFTGLTAIEGNALEVGDDFLVMDDTVAKRIPYSSAGFPVNEVATNSDTLGAGDLNQYIEYTYASGGGISVVVNTGFGVPGNWIMLEQAGIATDQITISGTAQVNSAIGLKSRTLYSVITLICKGGNVWTLTGDLTT